MGYSKFWRVAAVVLFSATLAGSIIGQDMQKEKQVARIAAAIDEIDTLINIHYETGIFDESEADGVTGIATEVWADFESDKWVAVYSSEREEGSTVYQSQMYNGKNCYLISSQDSDWVKQEDAAVGIPNLSALKEFYYNEEDLTGIKVSTMDGKTVIEASLTKEAIEEAYQSGISSAQISYEFYQENDPQEAEIAALLVESAEKTQIQSIQLYYMIDEKGMLLESKLTQQYSSPEIINEDGAVSLGEAQQHTVTYEKKIISYNSKDASVTLQDYFSQIVG